MKGFLFCFIISFVIAKIFSSYRNRARVIEVESCKVCPYKVDKSGTGFHNNIQFWCKYGIEERPIGIIDKKNPFMDFCKLKKK